MNNGLVAALVQEYKPDDKPLPPDFALIRLMNSEPKSLDKALRSPDAVKWQEALDYEINQLEKLGTWIVEDLPKGQMAIPCSKVLKIKRGLDGEIQKYCVQIITGSHRQVEGVNYTETFSAAAKMPTVHSILANAAKQYWEIEHVNMKSAYLNAPLKETVYMQAPHGVLKQGEEGKVLRLVKGLYGLKQASRGWYLEMMRVFVENLGFKRSKADHSVFCSKEGDEHTVVAVATDDMAVTSKRKMDIKKFKTEIKKHWDITNNGPINWFLGFKIKQDQNKRTLAINQCTYIMSMTEKFQLTNAKLAHTPMEPNVAFLSQQSPATPNQLSRIKGVPYSEAIGSVLWPAVVSRLDIAFAVGILSQFIQNPGQAHWEALKRVISYLHTTKDLWLTFGGRENHLMEGFCDAD